MELRDYQHGDEIKILDLFRQTFGKPMSEDYWKWRFIDNPINKIMIKLMWDNETLVGHYAVSPVELIVNNEVVLTALSMTTMTHPDYAGQGIFKQLAESLYEDGFQKQGLKAVWGFPNNNSHYAFIKNLNWIDLEQIPTLSIDITKIKNTNFDKISVIDSFNKQHVITQQKLSANYKVKVHKSAEYLNWRYLENPINKYYVFEFKNNNDSYYAITKVFPSFTDKNKFEVDILELNFPNDFDSILQLMNAIVNEYKNVELLKINTWLPINDSKHILLEKMGFVNAMPITYSGIRVLDTSYNQLTDSKEWLYSMGDSDVY